MDKINIGGFLLCERNDEGEIIFSYLDDMASNSSRLTEKNVRIIKVIIENCLKYDNYITSAAIAEKLNEQYDDGYDYETIKKAIQRIRNKSKQWKDAIDSSRNGFRIKFRRIAENSNPQKISESNLISNKSDLMTGESSSTESTPGQSTSLNNKSSVYISNFIRNRGRIRTYYYDTTLHDVHEVFYPISLTNGDDNTETSLSINSLFENNERHRYIISGQIGTGKSLLAQKLALDAAKEYPKLGIIPILFDLRLFVESNETLFDILKKEYQSYIPDDEHNLVETMISLSGRSDFSRHCQQGALLLLLDGLDEIDPELKESFLSKLKDFLRSYGNNTIIIFSRPTGKFLEFESFSVLHIKLLSKTQNSEMIDQLIGPYDREEKKEFKNSIIERYDLLFESNELFYNPLFLSILCSNFKKKSYYYKNIRLRESVESFIRFITCEDQSNQHPRPSKRNVSPTTLREDLCWFCNYLVTHDLITFDIGVVDDYLEEIGDHDESAEDFLDDLCRVYGLIQYIDGRYRFIDDLIVEYFFVSYVFTHDNNLFSVPRIIKETCYYSADNILDILYNMNKRHVAENVYCTFMNNYATFNENGYKEFLKDLYPKIFYYVGQGEFNVRNNPDNDIYQHLIRDLDIEQNKSQLRFPAVDKYKLRPVYKLSKANAEKLAKPEGLIDSAYCDRKAVKTLKIKPAGYIYTFNVNNVISGHDEESETINRILMSDDFPLRKEYNQALLVCSNIEEGECDL